MRERCGSRGCEEGCVRGECVRGGFWSKNISMLYVYVPSLYTGFPSPQTTFHPPIDPLVMIGPGTGVPPFVVFLHHWRAQRKGVGSRWLFFGYPEKDYIYRCVYVCVGVCMCVQVKVWCE